jgi:D-sedoheptulose 7-phosphate isomerase
MTIWQENLNRWQSLTSSLSDLAPAIDQAAQRIIEALKAGNKILACGNGGSAAEASHLCTELVGRYDQNRRSLPAVALAADASLLTCVLNDYGPNDVFARQVHGLGVAGDCLIGLSTSGASNNVAEAFQAARDRSVHTIALLGNGGPSDRPKPMFGLADQEIVVPSNITARIQEAHLLIIHTWCDLIDRAFA